MTDFTKDDERNGETTMTNGETMMTRGDASSAALTPVGSNPFLDHADAELASSINGKLLLFNKGDWVAGKEKQLIPIGTKLIANMDTYSHGWTKWVNGKPVEYRMGRIVDRFRKPYRSELDSLDKSLWELNDDGDPKDPWQETKTLELADPTTAEVYTYSTGTNGGFKCLALLSREYGRELRKRPNEWPVVALGCDSYMHPMKSYGRVKEPLLTIVGWVSKDAGPASAPAAPAPTGPAAPAVTRRIDNPVAEEPPAYEAGDPGPVFDDYDFR
jgi:hypothetical protein